MAEAATADIPTLSEQYLLKKEEKLDVVSKTAVEPEVESPPVSEAVEVTTPITEETPIVNSEETDSAATVDDSEASGGTAEDSNASAEQEESRDQEVEQTPEIKLETAPADFRFPTTNQTRHCFTRYIEYHRCVAAKGDDASECDKFAKYYRSLCPGEWIEIWNEQRENGTFPGPL